MNVRTGGLAAHAFFDAGYPLAVARRNNDGAVDDEFVASVLVGVTNIAFACELAFKVRLFPRTCWPKADGKHDLHLLFSLLVEKERELIEGLTIALYRDGSDSEYDHDAFANDLIISRDAFVDIRYWHEYPGKGHRRDARVKFMSCFGSAVMQWFDITERGHFPEVEFR